MYPNDRLRDQRRDLVEHALASPFGAVAIEDLPTMLRLRVDRRSRREFAILVVAAADLAPNADLPTLRRALATFLSNGATSTGPAGNLIRRQHRRSGRTIAYVADLFARLYLLPSRKHARAGS
jgi:hypothetical protein